MEAGRLLELAEDPRFIPGIYNYCDRWCERCEFTARCLDHAAGEESREGADEEDATSETLVDDIVSSLTQMYSTVSELARVHGVDVSAAEIEGGIASTRRLARKSATHPVAREALTYAKMTNEWFAREPEVRTGARRSGEVATWVGAGSGATGGSEGNLRDAIEVVRWYQHQIAVKLRRALESSHFEEEGEDAGPRDSDGSAKVALIGIDRSIEAWGRIRTGFSDKTDSILDLLLILSRLRTSIEQRFPAARSFVRPGFDAALVEESVTSDEPAATQSAC